MSNQFNIDYDFPGLCAFCHDEIADFNGSNRVGTPIIVKLKANFEQVVYQLNDGSSMRATVCIKCKKTLQPKDTGELMESIINGLVAEIDRTPQLEGPKKIKKDSTKKLFITQRVDKPFNDVEVTKITKPKKAKLRK